MASRAYRPRLSVTAAYKKGIFAPMRPTLGALVALVSVASGACCGVAQDFKKSVEGPEQAVAEPMVRERVARDPALARQLCGVDAAALKDVVVKRTSSGRFSVEGKPASAPAGAAGAGGRSPVDPARALVCAGVLSAFWEHQQGPEGSRWRITRLEVEEVTTPGVEFKKPHHHHG